MGNHRWQRGEEYEPPLVPPQDGDEHDRVEGGCVILGILIALTIVFIITVIAAKALGFF